MPDTDVLSYTIPVSGFRSRKAAQICAWFARKNGDQIEKLKLIKLVYYAERIFLRDHHLPMLFDEFYSLYNGPICSSTLNGINGIVPSGDNIWDGYIARNGNLVTPVKHFEEQDFDEISLAEWDVIKDIWHKFGHKTPSQLRNHSHEYCPEWTAVAHGRRLAIEYREILAVFNDDEAEEVEENVKQFRSLESLVDA